MDKIQIYGTYSFEKMAGKIMRSIDFWVLILMIIVVALAIKTVGKG